MALITCVLGDCGGCKGQHTFGDVDVYGDYVYREVARAVATKW